MKNSKSCLNCDYFKMSKTPPTMRGCQYTGKIKMNGSACGCWRNCYSLIERGKAFLHVKKLPKRSMTQ